MHHLLLHCFVVSSLWEIVFALGPLGFPQDGQGSFTQLEGILCGQEEKKDLEFRSLVHFLDSLEGDKPYSF